MNDKIREVALRVGVEYSIFDFVNTEQAVQFLTRCLQELSKDVEPVAWIHERDSRAVLRSIGGMMDTSSWLPCYLHQPLTEQDKLDAARWRAYQKRKQDLLDRGFLRNPLRDEAIDRAMENGK